MGPASQGPVPYQAPNAVHIANMDPNFPGLMMPRIQQLGDMGDWRLSKIKVAKEFVAWNGMTAGYRNWVTRIHDHAQSVNANWRRVLDHIRISKTMLTWYNMWNMCIDGVAGFAGAACDD